MYPDPTTSTSRHADPGHTDTNGYAPSYTDAAAAFHARPDRRGSDPCSDCDLYTGAGCHGGFAGPDTCLPQHCRALVRVYRHERKVVVRDGRQVEGNERNNRLPRLRDEDAHAMKGNR